MAGMNRILKGRLVWNALLGSEGYTEHTWVLIYCHCHNRPAAMLAALSPCANRNSRHGCSAEETDHIHCSGAVYFIAHPTLQVGGSVGYYRGLKSMAKRTLGTK